MKNGDLLHTKKPNDDTKLKDWNQVENIVQRIIVTSVVLSLLFAGDK